MSKDRKSNKEAKKKPTMTMKEKRAAKKTKGDESIFLGKDNAMRRPTAVSGTKGP